MKWVGFPSSAEKFSKLFDSREITRVECVKKRLGMLNVTLEVFRRSIAGAKKTMFGFRLFNRFCDYNLIPRSD